jgi:PAS domain S-box-containing protein
MTSESPAWRKAGDLELFFRAARMVAWEFDLATRKLEYRTNTGTAAIRSFFNDPALVAEVVEQAVRGAGPYHVESRLMKPDGGVVWIRNQGEVVRDTNGRPIRVIGIAQELGARKDADELVHNIAAGISAATGEAFFRELAQHLCLALGTEFACIGELRGSDRDVVQTIAIFSGEQFSQGFEYALAGTPCGEAIVCGSCSYPHGVQSHFPSDRLLIDLGIVSYVGIALKDSSGEPIGVMSVMKRAPLKNADIAEAILSIFAARASAELERRRGERALRESESWNRTILSAMPDSVLVLDGRGVIRHCYAKGPAQLGFAPESAPGKRLEDVFPPDAAVRIQQCCTRSDADGAAVVEYAAPVSDKTCWFEARPVRFGEDECLIVIRDTTSKREAEADLQESRRFNQRIAETTPNVLFIYDVVERRNVYANDRSLDILGYTPQEIEQMGEAFITHLMHPDDLALLPALAKEYAVRGDGEVFEHVFRFRHKNGQWRWIHRSATIFSRTTDGRPKQILGAATDITSFKEAERDLQELSARLLSAQDEERRRIARELHDVTGQNLTALGLHLDGIQKSGSIDPGLKHLFSECLKLCKESQNEIRTLSYLLHPLELDLLGLVGALGWYVQGFEKRTGIHVLLDISPEMGRLRPELESDLFRVVQEGLTNIMRHSGSETAVIRLEKTETQLILHIEDNGRGWPENAGVDKQREGVGFGVGIPGMRERLRQYGGSLEMRSEGRGAILRGVVPLA